MKNIVLSILITVAASFASAQAKVMNAGEAFGQLVYLTAEDVTSESPKYKAISALSIPVFGELPLDMSVTAGAITLKQQTLLSHVQLKSRARRTPNLDISGLEGGLSNPLFAAYPDGSWVHMVLGDDGSILLEPSTEAAALQYYASKKLDPVTLRSDVTTNKIFAAADLGSGDAIRVGSKAANYAELAKALNTADRTVVRPGYAIPFYFYQEFVDTNPKIKAAIASILKDPLMTKVAKVSYREAKLTALRDLMNSEEAVVSETLIDELLARFETVRDPATGFPRKMKLRSSTNSEDLPNFNGAGLYDSDGYNPVTKKGKERSMEEKRATLKKTLRTVWASVWNLRAFDERAYFRIPHGEVKMGIQVNLSFQHEDADGVVVTKNVPRDANCVGRCVYIEVQRGNEYSVANPVAGVKPQKVLIDVDDQDPTNVSLYNVNVMQNSNIADDTKTILPQDNPNPVLTLEEIKDLTLQVMKAHLHFKPILGAKNDDFALDLEFKVDREDTAVRQVYLKQARPYLD